MRIVSLAAVLALAGCAARTEPPAGPGDTRQFQAARPVQEVWATLPRAYARLKVPGAVIDSARWTYGARDFRTRGMLGGEWAAGFVDCGTVLGAPAADVEPLRVALVTTLRPRGDATAVSISLTAETAAGGRDPRRCGSLGTLEARLQHLIGAAPLAD
ncbi:MAG TPA: hypothetical protein VGV85_18545 [Longimicrobiaceae bacterium]|nr:hypothetical protein [Longimicrobiaceae bacterium]